MGSYTSFGRSYRLGAGKGGKTGFEVGSDADGQRPLHVSFSFQKSDLETQNTGKVTIWNLNKEHLSVLQQKDCIVYLKAGYGTHMSLIFSGYVSVASTSMDSADRKTDIEVVDSLVEIRDTYVSVSYKGTVSWQRIFEDVAGKMGVAVSYSYNAKQYMGNIQNGYTFVGKAKTILDKGCSCCGLSWSVQNGVLQIKRAGDSMSKEVYTLNASTGLIGMPARVIVQEDQETGTTKMGWDVEYLLNGAINISDYVYLDSALVKGYFTVYSIEVQGDNLSGDWMCKARLLEVSPTKTSATSTAAKKSTTTTTSSSKSTSSSSTAKFKVGDKVKVRNGAKTYTGGGLASFVYTTTYSVLEIKGDRIVIGINGQVTAAIKDSNLIKA